MARFVHHNLRLLNPLFNSPLLDVLTELEHLRRLELRGTTPVPVFMQLKTVFHLLESLASARIEGNHTTLADYVERKVTGAGNGDDAAHEIGNIEATMREVEQAITPGAAISEHFIRQLHSMTVDGLQREGDRTPGAWRSGGMKIAQAEHRPPEAIDVPVYMQELVAFINRDDPPKYGLMKVALAHHRVTWVHPFSNGNGRVVRLLTYALHGSTMQIPCAHTTAAMTPTACSARCLTAGSHRMTGRRLLTSSAGKRRFRAFGPSAMTLLQSNASISKPSPRTAATGAFACVSGSWLRGAMGGYRPTTRGNFTA